MNIINYIRNMVNKRKNEKHNELSLNTRPGIYRDLIKGKEINEMIKLMPKNLTKIEKAYYIYIELGKIVKADPKYNFTDIEGKKRNYNNRIDNEYYGICKSISELYISILRNKKIRISADMVKKYPKSPITHIDTILRIDGKNYIVNLIGDLSRIKTSRRTVNFCFNIDRNKTDKRIQEVNETYLMRLEECYGKIDYLSRNDIEKLDKKLGYSFSTTTHTNDNYKRGLYTEDTIEMLKQDMNNPERFKEYILKNKDVPESEMLKYKLDYIFENIDKLTDYNGKGDYLENIRYYLKIGQKVLSQEERERIQAYVATLNDDMTNIISIIKVKPQDKDKSTNNYYYLYSKQSKKYISQSQEEMKKFINGLDKKQLKVVGTFDRYNPKDIDELEP